MTEAEHLARCADIPLTLACLVVMGANKYDVTLRSLRADGRMKHLVRVRWEIAAAARRYSFSLPAIGRALNRDHTTVMHGLAMWRMSAQKEGELYR